MFSERLRSQKCRCCWVGIWLARRLSVALSHGRRRALPLLIRLKYSTAINRWTHQTQPVVRLHDATGGRLERSLVWRELLAEHAVSDVASIVFRDRFGCWSFLDL